MVFENPHALLLLPLASLPLVFGASRNQARVAGSGMLGEAGVRRGALLRVLRWLQAIAVILLVVAAAEPAAGLREVRDQWPRRGMVLAVDTSESMAAMDMRDRAGAPTTRLRAVRQACMRFVAGRPGDRIGLVIFGGRAATQCPPTVDGAAVLRALGRLECGALGRRTALGDGIALAAARIGPEGGTIILLSDGSCTAGRVDPDAAARVARERGACIRAVAVGSGGPAQVEVRLPSGRVEYRTKEYPADRETLRRVADLSGGSFMDAPDAASLARAMSQIARPEPAPAARSRCVAVSPLGWAFALAGGGLSAAAHALACTALRSGPELA